MSLVVGFGPNTDQSGALFLLHKMLQAGKAAAAAEHDRAIRGDDAAVRLDLSDEAKAALQSQGAGQPAAGADPAPSGRRTATPSP